MNYIVDIRDRRQVTLPVDILSQLRLAIGDSLVLSIDNQRITAKPLKKQSIETLAALQSVIQKTGVSESEFQNNGRKIRTELVEEIYGKRKN
jgi:antitoxin component of MazEF toxin-antitoxin module